LNSGLLAGGWCRSSWGGVEAAADADADADALALCSFLWAAFLTTGAEAAGVEAATDADAEADAAGACANAAVANRPAIRVAITLVMMFSFSGFRHRDNSRVA
jgi:hypothetical protein